MRDILKFITDNKRREVEAMRLIVPEINIATPRKPLRSMSRQLSDSPTGIIAEFKRRSPSRGDIHPMAMVNEVVGGYTSAGASACSILTDTPFFGGALSDLAVARKVTDIPLLRKDFIVDEYQIYQAALFGADAILLIAAVLSAQDIVRYTDLAHRFGLEVLLELHSMSELDSFYSQVDMVGINNRDLTTFHTDPALSMKMARELPGNVVKVAESGLTSMSEVQRLREAGYRGFLIGETFMKEKNPGEALAKFISQI